jgi:hypothetical protein
MASLQPSFGFKVDRAKEKMSTEKVLRASRPAQEFWSSGQKVSLRVVAREWVVRLQMFPRRAVNEQKCHQGKSLKRRL